MIVKIIDYYYYNSDDAPVLCIKARDKNMMHYMLQVKDKEYLMPRFGMLKEEGEKFYDENKDKFNKIEPAPNSLYDEEVVHLFTDFPWQVGKIKTDLNKEKVQTFGADIKWEKMAISHIIKDCGLEGAYIEVPDDYMYKFLKKEDIKPVKKEDFFLVDGRVCYWDIETDTRNVNTKITYQDYSIMPIVSITSYDNYDDEYNQFVWHPKFSSDEVRTYENYTIVDNVLPDTVMKIRKIVRHEFTNEKKLLESFFEYFNKKKFDFMFGFFSVGGWKKLGHKKEWQDGFDMPVLYKRAVTLGLTEEIQKMSTCPMKYGYKGRFDSVYLRTGENKHEVYVKGVSQIDFVFAEKILAFAQKYYDFRGHKLSDWARYFLKYNKLDKDEHSVYYYWDQSDFEEKDEAKIVNGLNRKPGFGIEFMLDYNLIDVKICVDLDERFDVTKKQSGRAEVAIAPASDGLEASKIHDHYKLTHYQDKYSFDTKYQKFKRRELNGKEQIGNKFTITLKDLEEIIHSKGVEVTYKTLYDIHKIGGFVPIPLGEGVFKDIAVIDFSKYYPNMIKSTNAGIETCIDIELEDEEFVYDKAGNKFSKNDLIETPVAYFRKDVQSLNVIIFDKWMIERVNAQNRLKEYMDQHHTTVTDTYKLLWTEQFNIKNFMNAGFGVLGLSVDRTYSKLCFNACTVSCQDVIKYCINLIKEDLDITIIGGDTDSMFIKLKTKDLDEQIEEAKGYCDYLNNKINDYLNEVYNIQEHTIKIGLETISDKFYVESKKHYIKRNLYAEGVKLDKPELEIKGMDLKKRATAKVGAELQEKIIGFIFKSQDPDKDVKKYIFDFDNNLKHKKWSEVCKRGPLQKSLDLYPESNETARAGLNTLKYMDRYYGPGSNPFLGAFKKYPNKMNGKFLTCNGDFKMLFDRNDEEDLKKAGFDLNWEIIREMCHKKTLHLLNIFGTNYYDVVEEMSCGGTLDI